MENGGRSTSFSPDTSEKRLHDLQHAARALVRKGWHNALATIPSEIRNATIGATSDGQSGLLRAVRELCPGAVQQRCQFHVLADLRTRLGKRAVASEEGTKRRWDTARLLLTFDDPILREKCRTLLVSFAHPQVCSKRTRKAVRWFCRAAEEATAAYGIPGGDMPLTTGSAEAMCKRMRRVLCQVRPTSPEQIDRALGVFVELYPSVQCRGSLSMPNPKFRSKIDR